MSKRDPAFLWETAALRAASARPGPADESPTRAEGTWVTLREAQRLTEIPVETLRKWARRGTVPTFLERRNPGTLIRKVDLDGVRARAGELGRLLPPPGQPTDFEPPGSASPTTSSPGTMIIPIDAWNKMLMQLGNLHEAGQQLATARERAAKAETEAKFLRERLAEMRAAAPGPPVAPVVASPPTPDPAPGPVPAPPGRAPAPTEKVWQFIVRRLRRR